MPNKNYMFIGKEKELNKEIQIIDLMYAADLIIIFFLGDLIVGV